MEKAFNELYKKYGFNNPNKSRDDLSEDEERNFIKDCFDTYEHIGFADTFGTPYTGEQVCPEFVSSEGTLKQKFSSVLDDPQYTINGLLITIN